MENSQVKQGWRIISLPKFSKIEADKERKVGSAISDFATQLLKILF